MLASASIKTLHLTPPRPLQKKNAQQNTKRESLLSSNPETRERPASWGKDLRPQ
ncbi:hypothetical protein DBR06_SOUSAS11110047 [Sousa chinensis]|nr:hypothetical protein DBR06_SOUSAS11110047 [Sousa chinensis]